MMNIQAIKSGNAVFLIHFILGLIAFFTFFAAMFNAMERLMLQAAFVGLVTNLIVSALLARKDIHRGMIAATIFAAPELFFTLFSIGDAIVYGKPEPFLFWFCSAVVTLLSGLLGVVAVKLFAVKR